MFVSTDKMRYYLLMTTSMEGKDRVHGLFTCYEDANHCLNNEMCESDRPDAYIKLVIPNQFIESPE